MAQCSDINDKTYCLSSQNKLPNTFIVHADDIEHGVIETVTSYLRSLKITYVTVPSDVPAGYNKRAYICDVLEQAKFKVNIIVLITPEFSEDNFCRYVMETALNDDCRIVPILIKVKAVPKIISHLSSINISDRNLYKKLSVTFETSMGLLRQAHQNYAAAELELIEPDVSPVYVKRYWKNILKTSSSNTDKKVDYCVILRESCNGKRKYNLRTVIDVTIDVWEEPALHDNKQGHGSSKFIQDKVVKSWQDDANQETDKKFWFRFRKTQNVVHIVVVFTMVVYKKNFSNVEERVSTCSQTVEFITSARKLSGAEKVVKPYATGNEADSEDFSKIVKPNSSFNTAIKGNTGSQRPKSLKFLLYQYPKKRIVKVKLKGPFVDRKYMDIMVDLEKLGDNSKDGFQEFNRTAQHYIKECEIIFPKKWIHDVKVAILIKIVSVAHYQNKLKEAKDYSKEAHALLPHTHATAQLEARYFYYMSAICRESKKFGASRKWIDRAQEILDKLEPCEDTAKGYYNAARLFMKMLTHVGATGSGPVEALRQNAINCLLLAVQHFFEASKPDLKQIRRCLLNIASVHLNCPQTELGRKGGVTEDSVNEAKRVLGHLHCKRLSSGVASARQHVQVKIIECEVCYREACLCFKKCSFDATMDSVVQHRCQLSNQTQPNLKTCKNIDEGTAFLRKAIEQLHMAMDLATTHGFKEVNSVGDFEAHIDHIITRLTVNPEIIIESCSSSSDVSSERTNYCTLKLEQGEISDVFD